MTAIVLPQDARKAASGPGECFFEGIRRGDSSCRPGLPRSRGHDRPSSMGPSPHRRSVTRRGHAGASGFLVGRSVLGSGRLIHIHALPRHRDRIETIRQQMKRLAKGRPFQRAPMARDRPLRFESRENRHRTARRLPIGGEIHRRTVDLGLLDDDCVGRFLSGRHEGVARDQRAVPPPARGRPDPPNGPARGSSASPAWRAPNRLPEGPADGRTRRPARADRGARAGPSGRRRRRGPAAGRRRTHRDTDVRADGPRPARPIREPSLPRLRHGRNGHGSTRWPPDGHSGRSVCSATFRIADLDPMIPASISVQPRSPAPGGPWKITFTMAWRW